MGIGGRSRRGARVGRPGAHPQERCLTSTPGTVDQHRRGATLRAERYCCCCRRGRQRVTVRPIHHGHSRSNLRRPVGAVPWATESTPERYPFRRSQLPLWRLPNHHRWIQAKPSSSTRLGAGGHGAVTPMRPLRWSGMFLDSLVPGGQVAMAGCVCVETSVHYHLKAAGTGRRP